MEDEVLFETPNGTVITEAEAKTKYSDRFQSLIDGGTLTLTDKPLTPREKPKEEVQVQFDVEAFYISPNGKEISGKDVVQKYGQRAQSLVDDGTLKKKDQNVVSSGEEENMVGTTPIQETPDTLLESGNLLNNNLELNSIMVGEVPFSQLSPKDQQTFYDEIDRLEEIEKINKARIDNPYGIDAKQIPSLTTKGLNIQTEQDPVKIAAQELFNKKNAPTDFSKLVEGVEDIEKKDSSNRIDLLKKYQGSKGDVNLSFTDDGMIIGNRKTPSGVIATTPEVKDEDLNWFQKLFMSAEEYNEIEEARTVNPELLDQIDIDVSDYQAWEAENTKKDGFVYKQMQDLLVSDSENDYLNDKRNFKKLSAYVSSIGNEIQDDISVVENKLLFEQNPEKRKQLLSMQSKLKAAQVKNISRQYNIINLFPRLEGSEDAKKNRREEYIINQRDGDVSGGLYNTIVKTGVDSGVKFLGGILGAIPSWVEQGGNLAGFEMEGLRAINEVLDSTLNNEVGTMGGSLDTSPVERRTVEKLKPVTITWKGKPLEVGVTPEGDIVDLNTMVSMAGILSNDEVKNVNELAKKVPNFEYEWSAGSITQGLTGTIVNLIGLIKGGKWATKTIQKGVKKAGLKSTVPGGIGMGAVSYMSTVAGEVSDIKDQLMEAGVPEEEAASRAIMYGNGRASLDGIFSGLAGGNTKLLEATKSFPKILRDLALKPKSVVSSKVFQDKVKDLVKENAKELFVEELPVLFTGNALNGLANDAVGREILNESTSDRDVLETIILTIGATTGIGSKKLLSNNKRKDLIRAATQSTNIEKDIAQLVNSGQMSVQDGKKVYQEIYNMQTALNQTQGSVVMSGNQEQAAALLNQRRKLMEQRDKLEGPLKEDIDKKIEDVDKQIEVLKAEDTLQAIEASGETNTETDAFVEQTITVEEVPIIYGPEVVTHKTRSRAAIENWVNGGQIVGRVENLDGFVEGTSSNKSSFQVNRDNRQTPNFQQGGIYGNTLKKNEGGYVVISKPGTVDAKNFQPNLSFVNKESSKDSRGVLLPKPNTPARDISNYDIYKVVDGKMIKQNPNNFKTNKDAIQEQQTKEKVLSDDGSSQESEQTSNVELQRVGERDSRSDSTQGSVSQQTSVENQNEQDQELVNEQDSSNEVMSVNKARVDKVVDDIVTKTRGRNKRRGNKDNKQSEADNAISYLEQSKLYEQSNDSEREAMVQAINKKLGVEIPSPTKRQIDAKKNKKKLNNVDEAAALKDQIKLEVKAAKDAKKDQTTRRKALANAIKSLQKAGTITLKKANSLISKVSGVNLNNSRAVAQVLDYVTKVNNDANAVKKLKDADTLKKRIKKQLRSKNAEGTVATSVEAFLRIDPNLVNDIDAYNAEAQKIVEGLKTSKPTKDGEVKVAEAVDIKSVDKFTTKAQKQQTQKLQKAEAESFRDLTGLNSNEFTLEEMRAILAEQKAGDLGDLPGDKGVKADLVKKGIKKAFSVYQGVVDGMINNKVDPFTGEPINLSPKDLNVIKEFMNIDLDLLNNKQAMEVLDAMVNFSANQTTGGMEAMINMDKGNKGSVEALSKKLIARSLGSKLIPKGLVQSWNNFLSQMPLTLENMFAGQSKARLFERLSGFAQIRKGASTAEKIANKIAKEYSDKFIKPTSKQILKGESKTNPNGTPFNDAANNTERGIFAFMRRTLDGTKAEQKAEFNRRKGLVKQTIDQLKKSDPEKAELYQNAYDKVLKDSNTISDLDSKVDPINKEAVEWMTNEWTKLRPDLENTSLNVYNRTLGKDLNYTPDSFSRLKGVDSETELGEPVFVGTRETIYDKETGVLMEKRPGSSLPAGRYLNLGFDSININSLKDAMTDVETAPGIQQLKGFVGNSNYEKVIPDASDRDMLTTLFKRFINAKRGIGQFDSKTYGGADQKKLITRINKLAGFGVSRVLGGVTQFAKQLTPLANTMTNLVSDIPSVFRGIGLAAGNKDANTWLNNSGYEIANRGIQAISNLDGLDNKLEQASNSTRGKAIDAVVDVQKWWLQKFLVNPDKYAARASWLAYYSADLKKQGIDPAGIDWKNHKVNERAGDYAQQQVARQQNTSDQDLQGDLFSSKKPTQQIVRKVLFPFANFLLNQKTRMYTDLNQLFRSDVSKEDRIASGKSIAGLGVETTVFGGLGLLVTQILAGLSAEDEDDKEKAFQNRIKGRVGNVAKDILSPIPITDTPTTQLVNSVLTLFQDTEDPNEVYQLFVNDKKSYFDMMGVLGIGPKKAVESYEYMRMAVNGKYTDTFTKKTKELTPEAQDKMAGNAFAYLMYNLGLLPSEVGSVVNYNVKALKKLKDSSGKGTPIKKITKPKPKKKKSRKKSGGSLLDDGGLF